MCGLYSRYNSQFSALAPPNPLVCPFSWVWERGSKVKEKAQAGNRHSVSAPLVRGQKTTPGGWARLGPGATPHWEQCEQELSTLLASTLHSGPARFVQSAPRGRKPPSGSLCLFTAAQVFSKPSVDPACPADTRGQPPITRRVQSKGLSLECLTRSELSSHSSSWPALLSWPWSADPNPPALLFPSSQTHRSHPLLPIK